MITKKINFFIIGELGEIIEFLGISSIKNTQTLIYEAEKLKLTCLSGIDLCKDTYFNYLQTKNIIKNEISKLQNSLIIDNDLLETIYRGAKVVGHEKGYIYLKISGLPLSKKTKIHSMCSKTFI